MRAAAALGPSAVAWRAAGRGAAVALPRASYARRGGRGDDDDEDDDEESDTPSTGSHWRLRALAEAGSRGRAAAAVADNAALEDAMLQQALRESLIDVNSTPQRQSSAVAAPCASAAAAPEHDARIRKRLSLPSYTSEPVLELSEEDDDADALAAAIALSMVLIQEAQPREPAVAAGAAACRSTGVPGRSHAREIAPSLSLQGSTLAASAEAALDDTSAAVCMK